MINTKNDIVQKDLIANFEIKNEKCVPKFNFDSTNTLRKFEKYEIRSICLEKKKIEP